MKPHLHLTQFLIVIASLLSNFQACHCKLECNFKKCTRPFRCGDVEVLLYPFWGHNRPPCCGHPEFKLRCIGKTDTVLSVEGQRFRVLKVDEINSTMRIARRDLRHVCPDQDGPYVNTTLSKLFRYTSQVQNLSIFYECPQDTTEPPRNYFSCKVNGTKKNGYFVDHQVLGREQFSDGSDTRLRACGVSFSVPLLPAVHGQLLAGNMSLRDALRYGVDVKYNAKWNDCKACMRSGGMCATDTNQKFLCYGVPVTITVGQPLEKGHRTRRFVAGIGIALGAIGLSCVALFAVRIIGRMLSSRREPFLMLKSKNVKGFEQVLKQNGLAPKRYRYSAVKKMTKSFKDRLGEGGFGIVYKGSLQDGRPVAVKILNKSEGNGDEFINEVAIISRTSHVNIVSLLGFCFEGCKRALIYEFMANGSLEKFIYSRRNLTAAGRHLGWENLYEIAHGIARGLEYLHRGCNARILHFDIKPHNILLDEDFHPKISDFGLAKLCSKKGSIVPINGTRGTVGYIAPEVFSRMFGQVSHKSDVYSYGMMVLEMVGGRTNVDNGEENSSKRHFPSWAYKHLQQGVDLVLSDTMNIEENEIAKKMVLVGLWCVQTNALDRPSIKEVIDMLEGSIDTLELPPNPFFYSSASRPPSDSFLVNSVKATRNTL